MAVDQTQKRRNLAADFIVATEQFTDALFELAKLVDEYQRSGITFAETDFSEVESLKHLDVAAMVGVITSATGVRDWLNTTFNMDNLLKARR